MNSILFRIVIAIFFTGAGIAGVIAINNNLTRNVNQNSSRPDFISANSI